MVKACLIGRRDRMRQSNLFDKELILSTVAGPSIAVFECDDETLIQAMEGKGDLTVLSYVRRNGKELG